jgi:hypothetical protein
MHTRVGLIHITGLQSLNGYNLSLKASIVSVYGPPWLLNLTLIRLGIRISKIMPDSQPWRSAYLFKRRVSGGGGGSAPTTGQTVAAAAVVQWPFGLPLFDWCKFQRRHLGEVVSVVPPPSCATTAAPTAIGRAVAVEIVVESLCCLFHLKKMRKLFINKEEFTVLQPT